MFRTNKINKLQVHPINIQLIELIGVNNFTYKLIVDHLKIQNSNPETYRSLVHYFRNEQTEFHTFQLKEDKPMCIVICNLHSFTSTEIIKSELEHHLYKVDKLHKLYTGLVKSPCLVDLELTEHSN